MPIETLPIEAALKDVDLIGAMDKRQIFVAKSSPHKVR